MSGLRTESQLALFLVVHNEDVPFCVVLIIYV